jgi:ABC-type multidrug transport system ATPase subunit
VSILTVTDLTRRFGPHLVLDGLTFEMEPGTATVAVGPNGSGKTTLLRCVAGAEEPDGGTVRLGGRPMDESDPRIRAAVAVLLDDVDFFPDLSVVEHLRLLVLAHGADGSAGSASGGGTSTAASPGDGGQDVVDVDAVVAELGLEEARDQLPATLSSGQRRRLALASCFVRPRRLLILDEPEQRLDVAGRAWLVDRLLREKARGTAILMASHDPEVFEAVADRRLELGT